MISWMLEFCHKRLILPTVTLELGTNDFSGTLASEIGLLTNLRTLYFAMFHTNDCELTSVGNLNIERNNLVGGGLGGDLPTQLAQLTNLGA